MHRYLPIVLAAIALISACEEAPPPPKVEVKVTVEEKEKPKKTAPKDERGTIVGNSEGFYRP